MPVDRRWLGALALLIFAGAQPALAQAMPGGHPRDHANRNLMRRMEYRAEMLGELNELMSDWRAAWSGDQLDEIAELYTDDAVVSPPGETPTARGRDAVAAFLAELLAGAGGIETNLADFDVGESLAYAMGQFSYPVTAASGVRVAGRVEGKFVTVFRQEGSHWRIRSQLFQIVD